MRDDLPAELSLATGYAVNPIDRLANFREDEAHIAALRADPASRFIVIGRDRPVLKRRDGGLDPFFSLAEVEAIGGLRECALLGRNGTGPLFAQLLDHEQVAIVETADDGGLVDMRQFIVPDRPDLILRDLRAMAMEGAAPMDVLGLIGEAKSLLHWHARHRYCSNCGHPSEVAAAGWRRQCGNCRAQHFPRTDPVVIMLVEHGEKCLLGRQPRFNKGMYSALAGFLEPGETIEDAVRREVFEEAGVRVGRVAYLASQPWPFPSSLMIGCIGEALTEEIVRDEIELEDCRWFTREDVRMMFERNHPDGFLAPHPLAIAHHLLRAWRDGETTRF